MNIHSLKISIYPFSCSVKYIAKTFTKFLCVFLFSFAPLR